MEGRDLSSRRTQDVVRDPRGLGNLSTPKSVQKLQTALHAKAKAEAGYRFYALYDKISREDILAYAYAQCRSNKGAPGVDGQDFADIEVYGVQRWLGELALALRQETYRPDPIRRVYIPKANGKLRPLGISTLRDRVCMTAAMLVLEPIFEADLPPEQYAYRPGRNAQQAVVEVEAQLFRGHPEVVDADLADYFGSIPHAELLRSVARRIVDRRVLHLIKMWLECPVEETDDRGRKTRTTEARDNRRGIPQGSPISPLLANLYMRRFVLGWKMLGLERSLGARNRFRALRQIHSGPSHLILLVTHSASATMRPCRNCPDDGVREIRIGRREIRIGRAGGRAARCSSLTLHVAGEFTIARASIVVALQAIPILASCDRGYAVASCDRSYASCEDGRRRHEGGKKEGTHFFSPTLKCST